jgi:hypothetical protein
MTTPLEYCTWWFSLLFTFLSHSCLFLVFFLLWICTNWYKSLRRAQKADIIEMIFLARILIFLCREPTDRYNIVHFQRMLYDTYQSSKSKFLHVPPNLLYTRQKNITWGRWNVATMMSALMVAGDGDGVRWMAMSNGNGDELVNSWRQRRCVRRWLTATAMSALMVCGDGDECADGWRRRRWVRW